MKLFLSFSIFLLALGFAIQGQSFTASQFVEGVVVHVADGDTVKLRVDEGKVLTLRLRDIDAPERGQPYGDSARQALVALADGRRVRAETWGEDRYGRTLAEARVGEVNINRELVSMGAAWVYRGDGFDQSLLELERRARSERRGLWGLPESDLVHPRMWRRMQGDMP